MITKGYILTLFSACLMFASFGQNTEKKLDDSGRIAIKAYLPTGLGDMPAKAGDALKTRLDRIITSNGIGGTSYDNRFVLSAKIVELSKDFVATTPPVYNYELEVTLFIGDAVEGTLFASHVTEVKGAGNTENSAYMAAVKRIKDKSPEYQEFIDNAKTKIIEYYNSKCDFYLKEAQTLAGRSEFEASIATLTSIPEVCKECYDKAMDAVGPIYQKQIDHQCKIDLAEARSAWSASQDGSGAEAASYYLGGIDPNSSCFGDAQAFTAQIAKRINELDQREWNFKLKEQQDDVNATQARIKAARDIGVAYGNNQPKTVTYNVRSWWY
jgi:hypothetical protein